jgi:zinc/manganese transport system permease protein
VGQLLTESGKEARTDRVNYPYQRRLLAGMCAVMAFVAWPHTPAFAQEADSDIDALRRAALSEISTEKVVSEETVGDADQEQERQVDDRMNFFAMQICLIAVVLILHTYTGMHIIRRGIIFCDLVLDQLAAFGIVVGIAIGVRYGTPASYMMAMAATFVGCILLAVIRPKNRLIPNEAVIGIMYGMALVACLLLADKLPTGGTDLKNTLVGSMSWVSWPLVGTTAGIYSLLLLFHYMFRRRIIHITELDKDVPHRAGWDFLFFLSQGIITILIVPVAGVLLAYGFLMIPAAIGVMFTHRWKAGLLLGWSSGMVACVLGLFFSYRTDSPYGPSLMLAMGLFFLVALFIRGLLPVAKGGAS